ncbi:hypothetical protein P692DRAFT_201730195 [Suillus brevipes Sb2]|nr:hypothetical protein P692DRAFT_201730195 [Suillus brevipes Sb2]
MDSKLTNARALVATTQDVINPKTPHCNIMLLRRDCDGGTDDNYCYAKVLGIHHVNAVLVGSIYESIDRTPTGISLWELVGERSIEAMQEETLRRHQDICDVSGDGTRHAAVERFRMEERKKRCQMEVSLYSQAIQAMEQCRMRELCL